ncbi:MAG: hypothetical protein R3Y56_01920 [Akkermansia sp.]
METELPEDESPENKIAYFKTYTEYMIPKIIVAFFLLSLTMVSTTFGGLFHGDAFILAFVLFAVLIVLCIKLFFYFHKRCPCPYCGQKSATIFVPDELDETRDDDMRVCYLHCTQCNALARTDILHYKQGGKNGYRQDPHFDA